jgi:tRNA threonylcarbamoyladenosine biosynthesis protein TsaB
MKILAADTSTSSGSLALLEDGRLVEEWTFQSLATHNRRLLRTIDFLLRDAGWEIEGVDGFAVALGPGSFTGIRIGLGTIKTLAWALQKPFAGVPTLDTLAAPLAFSPMPVCAVLDARRKEVYYALFRPDGRGALVREGSYGVSAPERLAASITSPTVFCGDGWLAYRELFTQNLGDLAVAAPGPFHAARAAFVGELAYRRFKAGDGDDPVTCAPIYVRPSEAEMKNPHLFPAAEP